MEQDIIIPSLEGRGWHESGGNILPVWFEGNQFPPSLSRSKKRDANVGNRSSLNRNNGKPSQNKKTEPIKKKLKLDESSTPCTYEYSSSSSSSSTSSEWEVWEIEDFDSNISNDDPDW